MNVKIQVFLSLMWNLFDKLKITGCGVEEKKSTYHRESWKCYETKKSRNEQNWMRGVNIPVKNQSLVDTRFFRHTPVEYIVWSLATNTNSKSSVIFPHLSKVACESQGVSNCITQLWCFRKSCFTSFCIFWILLSGCSQWDIKSSTNQCFDLKK